MRGKITLLGAVSSIVVMFEHQQTSVVSSLGPPAYIANMNFALVDKRMDSLRLLGMNPLNGLDYQERCL
jgi:hypothetical protein